MILLIGAEKGGAGKTTLSLNLAVMRVLAGHDTVLVDTDTQASLSTWAGVRAEAGVAPALVCVQKAGRAAHDIVQLQSKYDTVIVDAGGRDQVALRGVMAVCDMMLVPVRPSQFDAWALDHQVQMMKDVQERTGEPLSACVVLNAVASNPRVKEAEELREVLAEYADMLPVLAAQVADRISFRRSAREGKAVMEVTGKLADAAAAKEMQALYNEVFGSSK